MIDPMKAAQAEGEAMPAKPDCDACKRAVAAIERWYAAHFHRAQTTGSPVISSDDMASLSAAVASAINPKE